MRILFCIAFFALLLMLHIGFSVTTPGFSTFGRSVTMNMAFHINDNKLDDIINYSDDYISSHESGLVAAIVSDKAFGTGYTELQDDYLLEMRQPLKDNRFYIVFTQGTDQTIANKTRYSIVPRTFGDLFIPSALPLYLRLEYSSIDILGRVRWENGFTELIIINEGKNTRGQDKVSIELIE